MTQPVFTLPAPYATLYTDKDMSAKRTTFVDKITLKSYLMSEVIYDRMTCPTLAELVSLYNDQNGDIIVTK